MTNTTQRRYDEGEIKGPEKNQKGGCKHEKLKKDEAGCAKRKKLNIYHTTSRRRGPNEMRKESLGQTGGRRGLKTARERNKEWKRSIERYVWQRMRREFFR